MSIAYNLVAAVFGPDEMKIAEWVITVPDGMPTESIVEQVLQMAAADETLEMPDEGMVYVALRPAEADDIEGLRRETRPTIH